MSCFLSLLVLLFFLLTGLAHGQPDSYVVFTEELAPVHYTENGKLSGIATEIVQAIFQEAGLRADIRSYPWKRTYQNALQNKDAFIYTINRTPEREELFQWIGPILPKRTYLYRLRSREDIEVTETADLKKYTTVVILGYALTRTLASQGLRTDKELIVTRTKKNQMQVFLKGRADLITGNEYTLARAMQNTGRSMADVVPVLLMSEKGYYLAANRQVNPELVERLRLANVKVQQRGLVQRVIDRYMQ
ncbi:MAG: transporter substrate-binding domain-containing protein [Desulfobulbaceae bacterium]|nr:transporter substrate-binding domain-containing protein [Desulfobulbaceae bacterium]